MTREEIREIRRGLKEISEGKVVPLNVLEKRRQIRDIMDGVAIGEIKPAAALRMLSDLGVVLKVEGKLPKTKNNEPMSPREAYYFLKGYDESQKDMAGYVTVESLVEK